MFFNKKLTSYSLIFGAIIIILVVFLIFPLLKSIRENSEKLVDSKKELAFLRSRSVNFEETKKSYDDYRKELEKVKSIFIDPNIPIDLIKFWEKIAEESNILIDISPASLKLSKAGDCWDSISFQMTSAGSFSNIMKFVQRIEASPYLIEIKTLNIKRLGIGDIGSEKYKGLSLNDVRAVLMLKVYTK